MTHALKNIAVAVSGGMDSLLALCLLKEKGLAVGGVHARFLDPTPQSDIMLQRLQATCHALNVPLHVLDFREQFHKQIIRPFAAAYAACATPNPCIFCNQYMKFGLLRAASQELGYHGFATGHYACFAQWPLSEPKTEAFPSAVLFPALDGTKNQTYFLSLVPQSFFENVFFPLGMIRKKDIPAMLEARGLNIPTPKESQEICFIPDNDYRKFLQKMTIPLAGPGPILLPNGTCVGRHTGLWNYTEGQRKGLGVAWSEPLYVLKKEKEGNILRVGPKTMLKAHGCRATQINIFMPLDSWPENVFAQTRYRQKPLPAVVIPDQDGFSILFEEKGDIPACGQTVAISGPAGHILAAGVITRVLW